MGAAACASAAGVWLASAATWLVTAGSGLPSSTAVVDGLVGAEGAAEGTVMRGLCGRPGTGFVGGHPIASGVGKVRRKTGFVPAMVLCQGH